MAGYQRMLPGEKAYRPVFAILTGERVAAPVDGFGADYHAAFWAAHLLWMAPEGRCPQAGRCIGSVSLVEDKIAFDFAKLDEVGLYGSPGSKRALSYEFCIPSYPAYRVDVAQIDPTVAFGAASPGRIGCGTYETLCIGSTHQKDYRGVLRRLADLPYVQRIDQSVFE